MYRLVDGSMPVCANHLLELRAYFDHLEARVILSADQIDSLVIEFGLRRDDLIHLHGACDPILGGDRCQMCETIPVDDNVCFSHICKKSLHPQWPSVYCSRACALDDG